MIFIITLFIHDKLQKEFTMEACLMKNIINEEMSQEYLLLIILHFQWSLLY